MGLTIFVDDPDLEDRVVKEVEEIIKTSGEPDPILVTGDIDYEQHQKPRREVRHKREVPQHLKGIFEKARQARAIVNNQRRREPTLPDYKYEAYVTFFWARPNLEPKDMLQIIREQQRGNSALSGKSPQDNYVKPKY